MSDEKYTKRQVRSRPGLTQDEALESLQSHPDFKPGTKITNFKRQGSRYTAVLLEPKQAEFPPKKDEDDDSDSPVEKAIEGELEKGPSNGPSDSDDSDGDSDSDSPDSGPPSGSENGGPPKPDKGKEKGDKAELGQILDLLHKITDALGLDNPEAALAGGPDEGPPPPPGPAPKGPPPGGAPHAPPPGAAGPTPPGAVKGRPGRIPPGAAPQGVAFSSVEEMSKQVPSFTATTEEDISIREAKADLEETYSPYKVKQIRRKEGKIHALLSVR